MLVTAQFLRKTLFIKRNQLHQMLCATLQDIFAGLLGAESETTKIMTFLWILFYVWDDGINGSDLFLSARLSE